jgi:hypothetical protein
LLEEKAEQACLSRSMCMLPLVTHPNNGIDGSLGISSSNREFEAFKH